MSDSLFSFDRDQGARYVCSVGVPRPVVATCAYAGLRVSEALGLRWSDLDRKPARSPSLGN